MANIVAKTESRGGVPGVRLFVAGVVVLLLFSTVHLIPMTADLIVTPTNPAEIQAKDAMRAVGVDLGPFHTDWLGLNRLLSASYSVLLYFVAALDLVALRAVVAHGRLGALAAVNAVLCALLLAVSLAYRFPPPAVFSLAAAALFAGSAVRARGPA